jgi:hypothetical protein
LVDTDRPGYREVLLEEKPNMVVGDVFSLDLALPLALVRERLLGDTRLVMRQRDYTPQWSRDYVSSLDVPSAIVNRLEEIVSLVG